MNMGIGKDKSDKIAELEQAATTLNAAIEHLESIVSNFNSSVQDMQTKKIGVQVHPQTLKSLNNICTNFVVEVGRHLWFIVTNSLNCKRNTKSGLLVCLKKVKEYGFQTCGETFVHILFLYTTIVIIYVKCC